MKQHFVILCLAIFSYAAWAATPTSELSLSFGAPAGDALPEVDSNGPTAIDAQGQLWFIQAVGGTMRSTPWRIHKGTTMDNLVHQYDYVPDKHWARPHFDDTWWAEGLWIDPADGTWYVVMHTEYNYNRYLKKTGTGYSMDRIGTVSLATSTDQGKSWTCHGELINSSNPVDPNYWEGKNYWDEARGDPALFVDQDYFYVYYNARWVNRDDPNVCYAGVRVARCRIADKMAPGKWTKWYQGKWDQPGLGGYDSDVFNENYSDTATVFWSKSRKCFVAIVMSDQKYNRATGGWEYDGSISTCTDLGKQDWTKPIRVCDKARKGYYTWVIDPKTRSRYVMESDTFRWYGTENRCRALIVTLTNAPAHPITRPPLYPPESVDDHNPGWDRSFRLPTVPKSQPQPAEKAGTEDGWEYDIMTPLAEKAIAQALQGP